MLATDLVEDAPRIRLDEAQQRAVSHDTGPCLVLAGPGSGKTRVIVERFLRLVDSGCAPERILVLTYTRKAANEMRERVEAVSGAFPGDSPLTNYHSFAQRVVRQHGWRVGIAPSFRIADAAERWLEVDSIINELRPKTLYNPLRPHDLVNSVLSVVEHAKQELVNPQSYTEWAEAQLKNAVSEQLPVLERHRDCALVYSHLDEHYKKRGILDHDDTILYAYRLIKEFPDVWKAVAGTLDYVMVDEYQDTNYAQAQLVETLVGEKENLLVVADDDQSIYKFRGASLANLNRFSQRYANHSRIVLDRNYRSTAQIVAVTRAVIEEAQPDSRIEKLYVAERGSGSKVEIWRAADEHGEMLAVAEECRKLIDEGNDPRSIAWLFRRHEDMKPAVRAMREAGVPAQVHGGRGYFQQREVKDLMALLRAIIDPNDSQALLRCLHLPAFAVSNPGRKALMDAVHEHDLPLSEIITQSLPRLGDADRAAAQECLTRIIELHGQTEREDARELMYEALEASRFLGLIDGADPITAEQIGANLNKFGELLEAFAEWSDEISLAKALRYLEVLRESRAADEIPTVDTPVVGVSLLTAHSAKGLEWPIVFISRCAEHRWPGYPGPSGDFSLPDDLILETPPPDDSHRHEERRLFYVASTRAKDRLIFTSARRYPHSWQDEKMTSFLDPAGALHDAMTREIARSGFAQPKRPAELLGIPAPKIRASVSDLAAFKECPRRYAYRAIYHLPSSESTQKWYGVLMHQVLQTAAARRMAGEVITETMIAEMWRQAW